MSLHSASCRIVMSWQYLSASFVVKRHKLLVTIARGVFAEAAISGVVSAIGCMLAVNAMIVSAL